MIKIRSPQDFLAGTLFFVFGLGGFVIGTQYSFGTATRMGPGFLPAVISVLLMLFGTGLFFRAVRMDGPGLGALHLRPFVSLPIALLLFSLLISRAGLPITIAVTIAWLTLTGGDRRWVESAILAVGMIAFCVGVFAFALGQPVPLWIR